MKALRCFCQTTLWALGGLVLVLLVLVAARTAPAYAQEQVPAVTWRSALDVDVYDSGFMGFVYVNVAFAPAAPGQSYILVKTADGGDVARFGFFDTYKNTAAVFARLQPENLAEHTFMAGDYVTEYYVDGALATRVPFAVEPHTVSDDPFNPGATVRFTGPWQAFAYFTFGENQKQGVETVELHFWAGACDLPPGEMRGPLVATLTRNGQVIGHTKRQSGATLDHVWMRRHRMTLFQPHTEKQEPNALLLSKAAIAQTGDYRLTVTRKEDGEVIRTYAFKAAGGALTPHPRTVLGYTPGADYIVPRVFREGSTGFEFEEAYWIAAP